MINPTINRSLKKNINGILLLNKSIGLSSNAALQQVKRLFNAKKAGHTGSLDPLATGMLPICFGEATKFSQFLLESDKQYQVTIKFGIKTTTGDAEGTVLTTRSTEGLTLERIQSVLKTFQGNIQQIPPMFSAIKVQGKPLYELARKGIEIEREPRNVTLHHVQCLSSLEKDTLEISVHCSKGTYIRTLAEDIGEALGCGAHVTQLHREFVSPYQLQKMFTVDELEEIIQEKGAEALLTLLLPVESSVQKLPIVNLSTSSAFYLNMGQPITVPQLPLSGLVRIYRNSDFIGVGEVAEDGRLAPRRLIAA